MWNLPCAPDLTLSTDSMPAWPSLYRVTVAPDWGWPVVLLTTVPSTAASNGTTRSNRAADACRFTQMAFVWSGNVGLPDNTMCFVLSACICVHLRLINPFMLALSWACRIGRRILAAGRILLHSAGRPGDRWAVARVGPAVRRRWGLIAGRRPLPWRSSPFCNVVGF